MESTSTRIVYFSCYFVSSIILYLILGESGEKEHLNQNNGFPLPCKESFQY